MSNDIKINVKGGISDYTTKEDKLKKLVSSNYFITLNPNKSIDASGDMTYRTKYINKFHDTIKSFLGGIKKFVDARDGWNSHNINNVDADYSLEIGKKKKFIHSHMYLQIKHRTNIKLNYQDIKNYFIEELKEFNIKNIHLSVKVISSSDFSISQYLHKDSYK